MSKISLNLKQFKHLKSDDKSTTLQHQDGHTLTLAHKSLSSEAQKQLSALAGIAKQAETPAQANEMRDQKMADGGKINQDAVNETSVRPDAGFGKVIMIDAEGGKVPQSAEQATHFTPSTDYDKGNPNTPQSAKDDYKNRNADNDAMEQKYGKQPVKQYAEGDYVEQGPTPVMSQDPQTPQPEMRREEIKVPAVDAATKRKMEIYNSLSSPRPHMGASDFSSPNDPNPNAFGPDGQPPQNFDPDTAAKAEQYYAQQQNDVAAQAAGQQQQTIQQNAVKAKWGIPTDPVPDVPQGPQVPGSPGNMPQPGPDKLQMPADQGQAQGQNGDPVANYAGNMSRGFDMQEAAQRGMGVEAGVQAQREQQVLKQNIDQQQLIQQDYKSNYDALEGERQAAVQDIRDGYISPEKYWKGDPSTGDGGHSKIAAGIGMILAGFNPTNNPNAAIGFLKFQMEQNLNAQAKNLQARDNILAHNIQQFGNVKDAANFNRVINMEMLQNQLGLAAAQSKGQMAKLNAQNAIGQLEREKAPLLMGISMNATMGKLAQQMGNPANKGNPTGAYEQGLAMMKRVGSPQAKIYEDALIPGVGVSKGLTPIPDGVKNQAIAYKNTNDTMNMTLDFARQYGGKNAINMLKNPAQKAQVMAQAQVLQSQLIGQIKQAQHDGVYKESEANYLLGQVGGRPDSFLANFSSVPKLQELQKVKQAEYSNLLGTYGIHDQALPTQQAAPQYKTVNGVRYQRGPNGQAIPVKQDYGRL